MIKASSFELDDEDIRQSAAVEDMMRTEGWRVLVEHLNMAREAILAHGKRARKDATETKQWAKLSGFDEATLMPHKIVKRVKDYFEAKEDEQKEELIS